MQMQIIVTIDTPDRLSSFSRISPSRAQKRLELAAVSGDELEGLVKELVQPPEVIQRMKTFLQN